MGMTFKITCRWCGRSVRVEALTLTAAKNLLTTWSLWAKRGEHMYHAECLKENR